MAKKKSKKKNISISDKNINKKNKVILGNLIISFILFALSFFFYSSSGTRLYLNLFLALTILFGLISLAFLISLLVYIFTKFLK